MLIFIYGEDSFRSSQRIRQMKEKFRKEVDASGMNIVEIDGEKTKPEEFFQQVKASPFLAKRRMVVIKNLLSKNKSTKFQDEISEWLKTVKKDDKDNILIFWETAALPKKKMELKNRMTKSEFKEEFASLKIPELRAWIQNRVKELGGQIDFGGVEKLSIRVGNDLWQMDNEIKKLVSYKQGQVIMGEDVEEMVIDFNDNIFQLVDAFAQKNKKAAFHQIGQMMEQNIHGLEILSKLIWQIKILLNLKLYQQKGQLQKNVLISELGVHPYVLDKSLNLIDKYSLVELREIWQEFLNIDLKLKSSTTSPELLLDMLVVKL